ncbi:MAG: hypothetical protein COA85_13045 [Robiginitomaculum sp.]|nr:MAG: hypothetical protein COA85_13045 [Robiginitomaculum sp.]
MNKEALIAALKEERLENYINLRGGFPLPLAGGVYWLALGFLGFYLPLGSWFMVALFGTGAIFPLGLLFAKVFKNNFIKEKQAVSSVIVPALIGMLLFWPMLIASMSVSTGLAILILAIGMSMHWPVVGWSYGRTGLYAAHSIIRALLVFGIWTTMPDTRTTLIPFAVAGVYFVTVLAILVDTSLLRRKKTARVKARPPRKNQNDDGDKDEGTSEKTDADQENNETENKDQKPDSPQNGQ